MFRISNYAVTMALLTHTRSASACEGVISSLKGECNSAQFLANLSDDCVVERIFPAVASGESTVEEEVAELCAYDAPVLFVEIQGTYQKDSRYFAGGGPLVDGGDWNLDSAQVDRFDANLAAGAIISWPEYAARVQYNEDNGYGENGYPANMNLETDCTLKTAMCCFTEGDFEANGDAKTDVCHHDLYHSPQSNHIRDGWSVFPGAETPTHCVGFTWQDEETEIIGNMLYDVSLANSLHKGYLKGVPGAPMCGCIENMPVVEEASCRTAKVIGDVTYTFSFDTTAMESRITASHQADIVYEDCANPDLAGQFKDNAATQEDAALIDAHLVGAGNCIEDVTEYLNEEQFLLQGQHSSKYIIPDESQWSELVAGEGVYFQPPSIFPEEADTHFRGLVDGGCTNTDGTSRYCIIRRTCASCTSVPHRDIYYKRYTALPPMGTDSSAGQVYLLDMFMNNWFNYMNDMTAGDFALFSTYEDALNDENAWTFCNYNDPTVGFPRDCGPYGYVGCQWNSFVRRGCYADHHGWYVEKPTSISPL